MRVVRCVAGGKEELVALAQRHLELARRRGRHGADPFTQPAASCKRGDILTLPLEEYIRWAPEIEAALRWSARFLGRQGVFNSYDLPYRSQISSLAAIRTVLGDESDSPTAEAKMARWYWCGVLGELYSGSLDSRLPRDLEQVGHGYGAVANLRPSPRRASTPHDLTR